MMISCMISQSARADEIPESFHPVRSNAMGGASTAIANDENTMWTNPAGISRIRKARNRGGIHLIKFPNVIVGGNAASKSFYSGLQAKSDEDSVDEIASSSKDLSNKPFWALTSIFPMMMADVGGIPMAGGFFTHTTMKAVEDKEVAGQASAEIISDVGGVGGIALTNDSNRFSFGLQARYIGRYAYQENLPIATLVDKGEMQTELKDKSNKSKAIAFDVGALWTLADFWFPTVGAAVLNVPTGCKSDYLNPFSKLRENVCGTKFSGDFANEDAISVLDPTDIRFGVSITPRLSRKLATRIGIDVHHFHVNSGGANYGLSEIPLQKTIHVGMEVFIGNPLLPSPFSVMVGGSQGYYTMGASVRLGFLALDVATFGRDISNNDAPDEDRRYMGGISGSF